MTASIRASDIFKQIPNLPNPASVSEETILILCPTCEEHRPLSDCGITDGLIIRYACPVDATELLRITQLQRDTSWMSERGYLWEEFFVRPMGWIVFGGLKFGPKPLAREEDVEQ